MASRSSLPPPPPPASAAGLSAVFNFLPLMLASKSPRTEGSLALVPKGAGGSGGGAGASPVAGSGGGDGGWPASCTGGS